MFGIGLWKLLLLAAVITAVWFGLRRLEQARVSGRGRLGLSRRPDGPATVELERNPVTGAYEPRGNRAARRSRDHG